MANQYPVSSQPTGFNRSGVFGSYISIPWYVHLVQIGKLFNVHDDVTVDADAPKYWVLYSPLVDSDLRIHYHMEIQVSAGAHVSVYRNADVTDEGTALDIINFNEAYEEYVTAETKINADPTFNTLGTPIFKKMLSGDKQYGGQGQTSYERIMLPGTYYVVEVDVDANGTEVVIQFDFYEAESTLNSLADWGITL